MLDLVIGQLTTHLFRDGAPFLLLIETPPTFGRSLRRFHILHGFFSLILSPSCFAACAHHLSPSQMGDGNRGNDLAQIMELGYHKKCLEFVLWSGRL